MRARGIGIYRGFSDERLGASTQSFVSRQSDICFAYHQGDSESVYNIELSNACGKPRNVSTNRDTFPRISSRNSLLLSPEYQTVYLSVTSHGAILREMACHFSLQKECRFIELELYTREIAYYAEHALISLFFSLIRDLTIFCV